MCPNLPNVRIYPTQPFSIQYRCSNRTIVTKVGTKFDYNCDPVCFYSKQLNTYQRNDSSIGKECLSLILALQFTKTLQLQIVSFDHIELGSYWNERNNFVAFRRLCLCILNVLLLGNRRQSLAMCVRAQKVKTFFFLLKEVILHIELNEAWNFSCS